MTNVVLQEFISISDMAFRLHFGHNADTAQAISLEDVHVHFTVEQIATMTSLHDAFSTGLQGAMEYLKDWKRAVESKGAFAEAASIEYMLI
ncbi:hypothetical protein L7F22_026455 [Adiantum nelumboides]|nr:hypothetical protein [Adiantum nelumboides]